MPLGLGHNEAFGLEFGPFSGTELPEPIEEIGGGDADAGGLGVVAAGRVGYFGELVGH